MSDLTIVIGNKNYSSWSLRGWLALKATGAPFEEQRIWLYKRESRARILEHSPTGRVPVLKHGDRVIWESLAICEYLAEAFPAARLWPEEAGARALARAVATEMHGGFAALRREMPMDIRARLSGRAPSGEARAEIARIAAIWRQCRERFAAGGPFLFGPWSAADCMYAPVATRFQTYGVALDGPSAAYRDAVLGWPAMREWARDAATESETHQF